MHPPDPPSTTLNPALEIPTQTVLKEEKKGFFVFAKFAHELLEFFLKRKNYNGPCAT
jgi:hypothetical protein